MADKPQTYPKINRKNWWLIRDRFKKAIPATLSATFVTSFSDMTNESARANVISPLRDLKLIDQDGKPTALANRWRDDEEYKDVCSEIRAKIYPQDLLDAYPAPTVEDKGRIKSWFMRVGHVGDAAATRYTDTYLLLSEGDASKRSEATQPPKKASSTTKRAAKQSPPSAKKTEESIATVSLQDDAISQQNERKDEREIAPKKSFPIHIDVQVHISPDTSPEQIDSIFASMAKHLSKFL